MASVLPHSAQIRADVDSYLTEASDLVSSAVAELGTSSNFRTIYKAALATDAVVGKISTRVTPTRAVSRSIVQRVPVLVCLSQLAAARVELRRFIEAVFWTVYFSDHSVEWRSFESNPTAGIDSDTSRPINYCAHREPSFYRNYARELFSDEPSGLVTEAVVELGTYYGSLSSEVHAGATSTRKRLTPAFETPSEQELAAFAKTQRSIFAAGCVVLCGFDTSAFDRFPPVHRAWFDWVIGRRRAKAVRAGSFGR